MDREIRYAADAGLDYWAFLIYPPDNPMSLGLALYLQSRHTDEINFCLNLQGGWMAKGGLAAWPAKVERYVSLFRLPTYQTVLDGRPLVYLFSADGLVGEDKFSSWEEARAALRQLRFAARRAGLKNPYVAVQELSPARAQRHLQNLGLDAASAYAVMGGTRQGRPYAALAEKARASWEGYRAAGLKLIPLVTTGWDKRPRVENPVPWETTKVWEHYAAPTPEQLAEHLREALRWVEEHPAVAESRVVLIYAWNENDEGGWLVPTLWEGNARLEAIRSVLQSESVELQLGR